MRYPALTRDRWPERKSREAPVNRPKGSARREATLVVGVMLAIATVASAQDYKTSTEHFGALKGQAGGGIRMTWDKLPDWTGVDARSQGRGPQV
jgi:hypothetical protein